MTQRIKTGNRIKEIIIEDKSTGVPLHKILVSSDGKVTVYNTCYSKHSVHINERSRA